MSKQLKTTVIRSFQPPFIDAVVPHTNIPAYRIPDALPPNGVIPRDGPLGNINISVDTWPELTTRGTIITVMLTLDTDLAPEEGDPTSFTIIKEEWTDNERDNGFTLTLDGQTLTGGDHYITLYIVGNTGNMTRTDRVPFVIITRASGGDTIPPLIFSDIYRTEGITETNLVNDTQVPPHQVLPAQVPPYFEMRVGDRITPRLGSTAINVANVANADVTVTPAQAAGQSIVVNFDQNQFDAEPDGSRFFSYIITNQAGFVSAPATPVELQLAFGERPAGLVAPQLRSVNNNFITDERLHNLHIDIPTYNNPAVDDVISLFFRGADGRATFVSRISLVVDDLEQDPILAFLPGYSDVKPFDHGAMDIYYTVSRGQSSLLSATSPAIRATVNLDIPGGPAPDPTATENGNLRPLVITSANGEIDTITGTAVDQNATITIPFLAVVQAVPNQSYLLVGDVITVSWGAENLEPVILTTIPTENISIELPVDNITRSGGGFVPAHYTVSRTLGDEVGASKSVSPSKTIRVNNTNTNPGGREGLKKPYWSNRNKYNAINVQTIKDYKGCNFSVDPYENIKADQVITLHFHGTDGFDAANTTPKVGTTFDSVPLLITAANILLEKHNFSVPAAPFYTLCQGTVHVTYTVQEPNNGAVFTSPEALEISDMKAPTSTECTLPPA